jgi:hypothetical protein
LGRSIRTAKKNTKALFFASKDIGLEVTARKTKYMLVSLEHNAGKYHDINMGNTSFESVEHLKYLGTILTKENSIYVEIRNRLNLGILAIIRRGSFFSVMKKYKH